MSGKSHKNKVFNKFNFIFWLKVNFLILINKFQKSKIQVCISVRGNFNYVRSGFKNLKRF